jgi:hypothetical protein
MIVLAHVLIAISSIIATSVLAIFPSRPKLYTSYSLIAATLGSGTYLVISTHQPILKSCITGLVYLGIVMFGLAVSHYRMAHFRQIN